MEANTAQWIEKAQARGMATKSRTYREDGGIPVCVPTMPENGVVTLAESLANVARLTDSLYRMGKVSVEHYAVMARRQERMTIVARLREMMDDDFVTYGYGRK